MVDGSFAAVKFLSNTGKETGKDGKEITLCDESFGAFQDCRLLRKDELQVNFIIAL